MLSAFGVSVLFLGSYLTYHYLLGGTKKFPTDVGAVRYVYLVILATHVVLAAAVPFLAVSVIYFGLRGQPPPTYSTSEVDVPDLAVRFP